jgi:hypothetical protein
MRHFIADLFLVAIYSITIILGYYSVINTITFLIAVSLLLIVTLVYTGSTKTEEASKRFLEADRHREERIAKKERLDTIRNKIDRMALHVHRLRETFQRDAYVID